MFIDPSVYGYVFILFIDLSVYGYVLILFIDLSVYGYVLILFIDLSLCMGMLVCLPIYTSVCRWMQCSSRISTNSTVLTKFLCNSVMQLWLNCFSVLLVVVPVRAALNLGQVMPLVYRLITYCTNV